MQKENVRSLLWTKFLKFMYESPNALVSLFGQNTLKR